MDSHEVPAFLHAAAGGIGGIMALSILYPMDNLRTRMQVEADSMPAHEKQSNEAVIASTLQKLLDMARSNEHALELQAVLSKLPEIGSVARERIAALEKRRATWKQALRNVLDDDTMNVNTQAEKIRRFKGALSVWLGLGLHRFCSVAWVGCGEPMGRGVRLLSLCPHKISP